jgi:hypothetical protein
MFAELIQAVSIPIIKSDSRADYLVFLIDSAWARMWHLLRATWTDPEDPSKRLPQCNGEWKREWATWIKTTIEMFDDRVQSKWLATMGPTRLRQRGDHEPTTPLPKRSRTDPHDVKTGTRPREKQPRGRQQGR